MKKKLFFVIAILVVALAVGVAYAWFTAQNSVASNLITVQTVGNFDLYGGPISATNLIPANDPDPTATNPSAEYPSSTYFKLVNSTGAPMMFYAYLSDGAAQGTGMLDPAKVGVRIYLEPPGSAPGNPWAPGDFSAPAVVFSGHLDQIWNQADAKNLLSSRYWNGSAWVHTLFANGSNAVYRVGIWLDGTKADNSDSGKGLSVTLNFSGVQEEGWTD